MTELVCKNCNDYLGSNIDSHLSNNHFIISQREKYNLKGKGAYGKIPPFFNSSFTDKDNIKWKFEADKGFKMISPKMKFLEDGNVEIITDIPNIPRAMDDLCKKITRQGRSLDNVLPNLSKLKEECNRILPTLNIAKSIIKIDFIEYKRCLLKICYELGFYWLGEQYIYDSIAQEIRSVLCHPKNSYLSENHWSKFSKVYKIGLYNDMSESFKFWNTEEDSHIAYFLKVRNTIVCAIRIFKVFSAIITLTEHADKYNILYGKFLSINLITKEIREHSWEKEVSCLKG